MKKKHSIILTAFFSAALLALAALLFVRVRGIPKSIVQQNEAIQEISEQIPPEATEAPQPEAEEPEKIESFLIGGREYFPDAAEIDLSGVTYDDFIADAREKLICFTAPEKFYLCTQEDIAQSWTAEQAAQLNALFPDAEVYSAFDVCGRCLSSWDEEIEFDGEDIGNDGFEEIKAVLPFLHGCKRFVIADCNIDYELLAQAKEEFPERNIVWRVYLFHYPYMTDCERICTVHIDRESSEVLKYCTEVKYVDFGHSPWLDTCDFLRYMPHLEAAILALTGISDISALAYCPELEYLEICATDVSDLTPLENCTKLEYLNISRMPKLTDISPIYGLTKLKRVRIVADVVSEDMKKELAEKLPDCELMLTGYELYGNGWRYNEDGTIYERYALLREQMGYDEPGNLKQ